AYPDKTFPSRVVSLRNEPKEEQNVVSYEAVLAVDNDALLLRPGMTATATIVADRRESVLAVPNAALRFTPPLTAREGPQQPRGRGGWTREAAASPADGPRPGPRFVPLQPGAGGGRYAEVVSGGLRVDTPVLVDLVEEKKR